MNQDALSENFVLRLKKGDEIITCLLDYCQKKLINSAWVTGIGAVSGVELAAYNLEEKKYINREINQNFEIASLTGNVGQLDNKLVCHIHALFSDYDMNTVGGHLNKAFVAATCELRIEPLKTKIIRKFDEEVGLNLIA